MNDTHTLHRRAFVQCGWLTAATGLSWVLLAAPAYLWAGAKGLEGLSYATLLCLIPGWVVLLVGARDGLANHPFVPLLLSIALRMGVVLMGVLLIRRTRPDLGLREFLVWAVVLYLITLLAETLLLLKRPAS